MTESCKLLQVAVDGKPSEGQMIKKEKEKSLLFSETWSLMRHLGIRTRYGHHGYNIDDDSDVESDDTNIDDSDTRAWEKRAICILLFHVLSLLLCGKMIFIWLIKEQGLTTKMFFFCRVVANFTPYIIHYLKMYPSNHHSN